MVARKDDSANEAEQGPIEFKSPWKLLAVFGVLLMFLIVYGFVN